MTLARTAATASGALDPRFLELSSSLERDRALLREDLLGSVAHALGLRRAGLLTAEEAGALRAGLLSILDDVDVDVGAGAAALPEEEDVHMAVEVLLGQRVGAVAGRLHTGRSRNDQVALDLQLHLREAVLAAGAQLAALIEALCALGEAGLEVVIPGYTHRQRAIPITVGHWAAAGGAALLRDTQLLCFTLEQLDRCPLGAGALAGSSLPLQRGYVAGLLGFSAPTLNSLDTVGDRDGVTALCYLACRLHVHMSRVAADLVDFASREFGLVRLGDAIACGSSMMPHKKNPDVFELVRGRSARAVGDLTAAVSIARGLPLGYQRDLQEDRAMVTSVGPHLLATLELLRLGLQNVRFDGDAGRQALAEDATQATDLAEVLVQAGLPFRAAYQRVGALVALARARGRGLGALTDEDLAAELPAQLLAERPAVLAAMRERLEVGACVAARGLPGGPAPAAVLTQLAEVRAGVAAMRERLRAVPDLAALKERLAAEPV